MCKCQYIVLKISSKNAYFTLTIFYQLQYGKNMVIIASNNNFSNLLKNKSNISCYSVRNFSEQAKSLSVQQSISTITLISQAVPRC